MKRLQLTSVVLLLLLIGSVGTQSPLHAQSIFSGLTQWREFQSATNLLNDGNPKLARIQFNRFLEKYPESEYVPRAKFGLAETYYQTNEYDSAAQIYHDAAKHPKLPTEKRAEALSKGSYSSLQTGKKTLINRYIKNIEALKKERRTDEIHRQLVQLYVQSGRLNSAIELTERRTSKRPESEYWWYKRAVLNAQAENYTEAHSALNSLKSIRGSLQPKEKYLRAEIFFHQKDLPSAKKLYTALISSDTDSKYQPDSRYGLAWVAIQRNNVDTAQAHLKRLAKKSSSLNVESARTLARLHSRRNDPKAVDWYLKAIRWADTPRQTDIRLELANYYADRDQILKALPLYESVESPTPKGKLQMAKGYLQLKQYKEAQKILESTTVESIDPKKHQYYLSLALFHQNQFSEALDVLPPVESFSNSEQTINIQKLRGRIYFEQNKLDKARSLYKKWIDFQPTPEAHYYLGLVEERDGHSNEAKSGWEQVLNKWPKSRWTSRTAHQLARLSLQNNRTQQYERYISKVKSSELPPHLELEHELMVIRQKKPDLTFNSYFKRQLKHLKSTALKANKLDQWYSGLIEINPPKSWWNDFILPTLYDNPDIQRKFGARTLARFQDNDWVKLALTHSTRLLDSVSKKSRPRRKILVQHLNSLLANNKYARFEEQLTDLELSTDWSPSTLQKLGLVMARYFRSQNLNDKAIQKLSKLRRIAQNLDSTELLHATNEWLASFHINKSNYRSALTLLSEIPSNRRTRSGELNLTISHYYHGDTETAYTRITSLTNKWDSPTITLYDYAFRIFRSHNDTVSIRKMSSELAARTDLPLEDRQELLIKNIQYWINQGNIKLALNFIDTISNESTNDDIEIRIKYWRGAAYFNQNSTDSALRTWTTVLDEYTPDTSWNERILRATFHAQVKEKNWKEAVQTWKQLESFTSAPQVGQMLLTEQVLESSPDEFAGLIERMERDYPDYLSEANTLYWRGRLFEARGRLIEASKLYRDYLDNGFDERRRSILSHLGEVNKKLGNRQGAIDAYTKLIKTSDDPSHRIQRAIQYRKNKQWDTAVSDLNTALNTLSSDTGSILYQLGITYQQKQELDRAASYYSRALKIGTTKENWYSSAQNNLIQILLERNKLQMAHRLLERADTGPTTDLFYIDYLRRKAPKKALEHLREYTKRYSKSAYSDVFTLIALRVYEANKKYHSIIDLLKRNPESQDKMMLLLNAYLKTDNSDSATKLYHRAESTFTSAMAERLGHYFYANKEWRRSRGFYQEVSDTTPAVLFRLGRSFLELGDTDATLNLWTQILSHHDGTRKWIKPMFSGFQIIASDTHYRKNVAKIIDSNWTEFSALGDTPARKALVWSASEGIKSSASQFMKRIRNPSPTYSGNVARIFHKRNEWAQLEKWIKTSAPDTNIINWPPSLAYYSLSLKLRTNPDPNFPDQVNSVLNRATKEAPSFAPKLQFLLGKYFYNKANYQKAAIEFHKVKLLFEESDIINEALLNLAKSYEKINKPKKARDIYKTLSDTSIAKQIRSKAVKKLNRKESEQ